MYKMDLTASKLAWKQISTEKQGDITGIVYYKDEKDSSKDAIFAFPKEAKTVRVFRQVTLETQNLDVRMWL